MFTTTLQHIGEARLADMHHQAKRDALVSAARRVRRSQRQQFAHGGPGRLAAVARRARRPGLEPRSL